MGLQSARDKSFPNEWMVEEVGSDISRIFAMLSRGISTSFATVSQVLKLAAEGKADRVFVLRLQEFYVTI